MLYRRVALSAHHTLRAPTALRSLATGPFREGNDSLDQLLGVNTTAPVWGGKNPLAPPAADAETDAALVDPPRAPIGSLPPPSPPPAGSRTKAATARHALPEERHYHLHVLASRNNTFLTLTNSEFRPKVWVSAGLCGFKKVQRSGYEAGYQCAVRMFAKIAEIKATSHQPFKLDVAFSGYGFGREAVFRALMASEGDKIRDLVVQLKDVTPLKVGGGTKARKTRRL